MQVDFRDGQYVVSCKFEERHLPRLAGFEWDTTLRKWVTPNVGTALTLGFEHLTERAVASIGLNSDIPCPEGREYLPFQLEGIDFARHRSRVLIADQPGLGKAHPISTQILTPTGWTAIGDLEYGDMAIGWTGQPIPVTGIYDRGVLPIFQVEFDDGAVVKCDADHLWTVYEHGPEGGKGQTIDTRTLASLIDRGHILSVPTLLAPAALPVKRFKIDPIVAGADLATMHGKDIKNHYAYSEFFDYRIRDYALAAPHQAIEFLNGFIRKIGRIRGSDNHIRIDIINNQFAADIRHTITTCVRQLGGLVYVERRFRTLRFRIYLPEQIAYQTFGYSKVGPKVHKRWKSFTGEIPPRVITAVRPVGRDQCRCIKVDGPGNLYVTEHFVLTHNTIQGAGLINAIPDLKNALIIPPASLKKNWLRELERWLVNKNLSVDIADGKTFPNSNIVIINYDVLHRHHAKIREREWDLTEADEHHFCKNKDSRRTKELHGGVTVTGKGRHKETIITPPIPTKRLLMLSGTPLPNRTGDLYTTVRAADPHRLGSDYFEFHKKYCGAFYDMAGNFVPNGEPTPEMLAELNRLMKERFMIRRLKMDVLSQLPPKIRQIVPLPADGLKTKIDAERRAITDLLDMYEQMVGIRKDMSDEDIVNAMFRIKPETWEKYARMVDGDMESVQMPLSRLANARQELAIAKLPMVIEYAGNLIEQGEKVVIFAYHRAVIQGLIDAFPNSAVIYGDTPMESKRFPERTRQAQQDRFQEDKNCRSFIGQYTAAGTGWTLTAANHWVGAEMTYVPHELLQAEDRCHRIGSEIWDAVWAHHLVVEGSLDDNMVLKLVRKMQIIEQALD